MDIEQIKVNDPREVKPRSVLLEAAKLVIDEQSGSTQLLCRVIKDENGDLILFNRAAKIMEKLEKAGIVGEFRGDRPREVLINTKDETIIEQLLTQKQT